MLKWIAASLVLALTLSFAWHETRAVKSGKAEVVQEYESSAQEQAIEALNEDIRLLALKGQADVKTIEDQTRIIAQRDALIRGLQQRPTRKDSAQANALSPTAGEACTGAQLPREDGEFLAREAARAEQLIGQRDYYYERYEDARLSLEKLNGKD